MQHSSPELGQRPRVLVLTHWFPPAVKGGGPLRTVDALTRAAAPDFDVRVLTSDRDLGETTRLPVVSDTWTTSGARAVRFAATDRILPFVSTLRGALRERPDLVYVNSFFDPLFGLLPQLLAGRRRMLVAPRGELAPSALASKPTKKRLVLALCRLVGGHRRVLWHASSERERRDIVAVWGPKARVVVRENETGLPALAERPSGPPAGADVPLPALSVAVAGRIVPTKGLDILLRALPAVTRPLDVHVYGNREDTAYAARCDELAALAPAHVTVTLHGSVDHDVLQRRLREHDVMATPTLGENFGHVVAESLAAGCPVAMADVSPWTPRLESAGGLIVDENTPAAWARLLDDLAAESAAQRAERRRSAADAFDAWSHRPVEPHVFDLALAETGSKR